MNVILQKKITLDWKCMSPKTGLYVIRLSYSQAFKETYPDFPS